MLFVHDHYSSIPLSQKDPQPRESLLLGQPPGWQESIVQTWTALLNEIPQRNLSKIFLLVGFPDCNSRNIRGEEQLGYVANSEEKAQQRAHGVYEERERLIRTHLYGGTLYISQRKLWDLILPQCSEQTPTISSYSGPLAS